MCNTIVSCRNIMLKFNVVSTSQRAAWKFQTADRPYPLDAILSSDPNIQSGSTCCIEANIWIRNGSLVDQVSLQILAKKLVFLQSVDQCKCLQKFRLWTLNRFQGYKHCEPWRPPKFTACNDTTLCYSSSSRLITEFSLRKTIGRILQLPGSRPEIKRFECRPTSFALHEETCRSTTHYLVKNLIKFD